jgi:hypothetical protein
MSAEVKLAQAPFDDARADLVLRSKDKEPVHFRVNKSTLSVASPVFADMVSLPSQGPPDEIQVVDLPENSEVIDLCLRHIYPVRSPEVTEIRQMCYLADFAREYQVDVLEQDAKRYLTNAIDRDPVGVFAIAAAFEYRCIVEDAVCSCLNVDFSRLNSPYVQLAPEELYWDLLMYHVACGKAASAVSSSRDWFRMLSLDPNSKFMSQDGCRSCTTQDFMGVDPATSRYVPSSEPLGHHLILADRFDWNDGNPIHRTQRYGPRCLWNYLYRSEIVLVHHPSPDAVTKEAFVLANLDCPSCPSYTRHDLLGFSKVFGTQIQDAIDRVGVSLALDLLHRSALIQ